MAKSKKLKVIPIDDGGYLTDTETNEQPPKIPKTKSRIKTKRKRTKHKRTKLPPQPDFMKHLQQLTESNNTEYNDAHNDEHDNNNNESNNTNNNEHEYNPTRTTRPLVTTRPRVQILPGAILRKTNPNNTKSKKLILQPYKPSTTSQYPTLSNVLSKLAKVKSSMMRQSPSNVNNNMVMGKCPKCHNMHMIPRRVAADTPPRYTNYEAMDTGYLSDNEDNVNNNNNNNYTNVNNTNTNNRKYKRRKTMRLLGVNKRNAYVNANDNYNNNNQAENNNNAHGPNTNEQNYTRTVTATVNTKSVNGKMNRHARVEVDNSRDNLVKVVEMHNGKKVIKYVPRE